MGNVCWGRGWGGYVLYFLFLFSCFQPSKKSASAEAAMLANLDEDAR